MVRIRHQTSNISNPNRRIITHCNEDRTNRKQITKLKDIFAQAIEKERCEEIKNILSLDLKNFKNCKKIINILQILNNKLNKPHNQTYLISNRKYLAIFLKNIEWESFLVGKKQNNEGLKRNSRFGDDNMLHYACRHGKTCFIDIFLDQGGFNINGRNESKERDTPLCIAADNGYIDTAKFLIKRGAFLNIENARFKTPLILATELIKPFDINMSKLLIENGALVNLVTKNMNTVFLSASKFGDMELIRILYEKENADINAKYNDGANALMRACYYNHYDLVKYLLDKLVLIETINLRNETALYISAFRGHYEIVKLMVSEYRANINCEDIDGDTPLTVACYENKPNVIHYLLRHGSNVNKHGIRGDTPLHIAVSNCDNQVVLDLILYGANVDCVNFDNETPLHIAVKQNSLDVIITLCDRIKRLNYMSNYSNTPFRNLLENVSDSPVKLNMLLCLIDAGCDVKKSFFQTVDQMGISSYKSSPLQYLFEFEPQISEYDGTYDEITYYNYTGENLSIIKNLTILIEYIIKSGYRPTLNDIQLYKQSWFCYILSTYNDISETVFMKKFIEDILCSKINKPFSLIDMCRVRMRNLLEKPLRPSISYLNIPKQLRNFLLFE